LAVTADKPTRDKIRLLLIELADAKVRRARAYSHLRGGQVGGRQATAEDARFGSLERISDAQSGNVRARDPEIIRVELAIALAEAGIPYPPQDG
jgi:hypothetical protein